METEIKKTFKVGDRIKIKNIDEMLNRPRSEVGENIKDWIRGRYNETFIISSIKNASKDLYYLLMKDGKEGPYPLYDYEIELSQTEWEE